MATVWKYPRPLNQMQDVIVIDMPEGAEVLAIQEQNGSPCLWCLVDPERPAVPRRFRVAGTGHTIDEGEASADRHVGTVQLLGGSLVFHFFECGT